MSRWCTLCCAALCCAVPGSYFCPVAALLGRASVDSHPEQVLRVPCLPGRPRPSRSVNIAGSRG